MIRKKTTRRWMKGHLKDVQVSNNTIEVMQEGLEEFVRTVCRISKELLDENNSLRKIQKLDVKRRIAETEVSEAIKRILITDAHVGSNLHASEVNKEVVGDDA